MNDNIVFQNNKRIAKNTFLLSIRMFFTMAIGIYSSRIILHNLGTEDFGIYNIVAGVISMFTFINSTMISGTQRYLNYYLGKKDFVYLNKIFTASVNIFFFLALFVGAIGEVVGLYFINFKLDIPDERLVAANIVFQLSVLSACINIISSPYNALIVSYEKMGTFAYVSVVQSILMLFIAVSIPYVQFDSLVVYALFVCLLQIGIRVFYGWYCSSRFTDIKYSHVVDKDLFKKLLSFSSWSFWGSFAYMTYHQGLCVLINIFFGPVVNAAQALATQVNGSVSTFSANFMMATKPQITKYYATGNMEEMKKLVFYSSKFSYAIMTIVAIPLIVRIEYLLKIWLKEVPDYTAKFIILNLLISIVASLTQPVVTAIQSTGKIRNFHICESIGLLLILPFSYLSLKLGCQPEFVYIIMLIFTTFTHIARLVFMQEQLNFSLVEYVLDVMLRLVVVVLLSWYISSKISILISQTFWGFIIVCIISVFVSISIFLLVGLRPTELKFVLEQLKKNVMVTNKK